MKNFKFIWSYKILIIFLLSNSCTPNVSKQSVKELIIGKWTLKNKGIYYPNSENPFTVYAGIISDTITFSATGNEIRYGFLGLAQSSPDSSIYSIIDNENYIAEMHFNRSTLLPNWKYYDTICIKNFSPLEMVLERQVLLYGSGPSLGFARDTLIK